MWYNRYINEIWFPPFYILNGSEILLRFLVFLLFKFLGKRKKKPKIKKRVNIKMHVNIKCVVL